MTADKILPAPDVKTMHDAELVAWRNMAYADLTYAAEKDPQSEWHASCFAALFTIVMEIKSRGLAPPALPSDAANDAIGAAK